MERESCPEAVDAALSAILARPEEHLGAATARACYETLLALQEAGEPADVRVAALDAFIEAKRRLRSDLADLLTV
jgi:hypothetical protein